MDNRILHHDIFLSYYGDDSTGSTDVMESLALNGIPTALFLQAPDPTEVADFRLKGGVGTYYDTDRLKAFGVAGVSRSMSKKEMDKELPKIFEKISKIPSDFFQLKVCSTFDSSPEIGNIGYTAEIALEYFPSDTIPLIVGAPFLNRFVIFGNLFARVGEKTFRLDRHPTMSKHPITPMNESDLQLHLGNQTDKLIQLMDAFAIDDEYGDFMMFYKNLKKNKDSYILFDTISIEHMERIGQLLIKAKDRNTQFFVGASGANWALAMYLQETGKISKPVELLKPGKADKMMVLAGSCAPGTSNQIKYMEQKGHKGIRLNTVNLISMDRESEIELVSSTAIKAISRGKVPLIYTALGPYDAAISETRMEMSQKGITNYAEVLAGSQGTIAARVIEKVGKTRIAVAGGDTSGYVSRTLGINALELLAPMAPGSPLCIAHSGNKKFDGLEIALKGGQNGNEKYFESIMIGELLN